MFRKFHTAFTIILGLCAAGWGRANIYDNEWENVPAEDNYDNYNENMNRPVETRRLINNESSAESLPSASSKPVRRFHEVLDELLAEFGYDVRMGQLKGLKNLSIRKVSVSSALPHTYRSYVEMLVAERIRENSRVRLVSCVPCKTKTSQLVEGKLLITSPTTNVDRMKVAADQLGVDNFMDVILVYHTTHMVLALQIFNTNTQEMVWTRTYNSETVKSRYQKLAIDYKQVAKSRPTDEYEPEYRFLYGFGGGYIPNVNQEADDSSMILGYVRGTEKFDNRRHEFGLHLSTYIRKSSIINNHATKDGESDGSGDSGSSSNLAEESDKSASDLDPWSFALALYGIYARHFVGAVESYDQIRHAATGGLGFILAPSYLAASLRAGWDIYFGRRFATNIGLIYIAPANVLVDGKTVSTSGGVGGELGLSLNF